MQKCASAWFPPPEAPRAGWILVRRAIFSSLASNWLPGGRSLAVQRLNRVQNRLDLLLADPVTGASSLLLREQDPYWVDVADSYRFLEDGKRLLWSSAREGYRHFYLYSIDGKLLHTITRGDWEVTDLAGVDESSKDHLLRLHGAKPPRAPSVSHRLRRQACHPPYRNSRHAHHLDEPDLRLLSR